MNNFVRFLGLSGSLRKESFNTALLHTISEELLPEDTSMEIFALNDIPLYNADLDQPRVTYRPVEIQLFRKALEKAEGLVICTSSYIRGIPGLLKNAIDWASRGEDAPLLHLPVAVMGATPGVWGTVRIQTCFHAIFHYNDMKPVYKPEIQIGQAKNKFEYGRLSDIASRKLVKQKLLALKELALLQRSMKELSM